MIYVMPTNPRPVLYSDSATLTSKIFRVESLIVMSGNDKTLTLPTPIRELAGQATWFVNNGTGTLTLSGAFVTGSSYVMDSKSTQLVVCLPTAASTYKWHAIGSGGVAAGLTESVTDIVGAMFTGTPTMTGITATFQDSTNDIDLAVAYASSDITTTATTSTSVVGSADTAARGDHQHGIGEHAHTGSTTGGALTATAATPGLIEHTDWAGWNDGGTITYGTVGAETFVFSTAAPATPTTVYRYEQTGNTVNVMISLTSADGNDAVPVSVKLPVAPKDNSSIVPVKCLQLINTTRAERLAYIDTTTSLVTIVGGGICTDGDAMGLSIVASYEVTAT